MLQLYRLIHHVIQYEVVPLASPPELEVRAHTDPLQCAVCRDNGIVQLVGPSLPDQVMHGKVSSCVLCCTGLNIFNACSL